VSANQRADPDQAAYDRLSAVPPEGKHAIRAMFASIEGLFRLIFSDASRLDACDARKLPGWDFFREPVASRGIASRNQLKRRRITEPPIRSCLIQNFLERFLDWLPS